MDEDKNAETTELTEESGPATQSSQSRKPARKRTKTGCLTCRRRRIKCGEERPVCQNCIKSKRECEGYTQRVISRHPLSMLSNPSLFPRGPAGSDQPPMPFDNPYLTSPTATQPAQHQSSLLPLAPRPVEFTGPMPGGYNATLERDTNFAPGVGGHESNQITNVARAQQTDAGSPDGSEIAVPASNHQSSLTREPVLPLNPIYTSEGFYQGRTYSNVGQLDQVNQLGQNGFSTYKQEWNGEKIYMSPMQPQQYVPAAQSPLISSPYEISPDTPNISNVQGLDGRNYALTNVKSTESAQDAPNDTIVDDYDLDDIDDMDDSHDVGSDEKLATERSKNLQTILAISRPGDSHHRSFSTYLNEPNFLTTYRPSPLVSPLMDSKCARIFCHFVASTGPLLSIFERHPINPSVMFTGGPVPQSQQGLWTYTLPMKALGHQGLLHAILAVASLHISRLQQTSPATSHKHYHFALRRVAKAVGLPDRAKQVETLAASLLLGFYEVITGEHSKWNSHIAGAAQLLREIDFVGMTRTLRAQRADNEAKRRKQDQTNSDTWWGHSSFGTVSDDDPFAEKEGSIDESFISTLAGRAIRYDEVGVVENEGFPPPKKVWTAKDIDEYRIQSDLLWWYCKQDLIRSMVSGNPLMMPFDRWAQCPPRAGFGRLDAVYGTMDHLFLLMARVCTFGATDKERKVKVMEANGGQYKPPGFSQTPNTGAGSPGCFPNDGSSTQASRNLAHGVSPENQHLTSTSDERGRDNPPESSSSQPANPSNPIHATQQAFNENMEIGSLEAETAEARVEWSRILAAFEAFSEALGPGFAPLPPDSVQSITTPFGAAVQYRTHTIAFLMAFYYTGRIMLERLHPDMPPATMVAAGIAAPRTARYSQFIGKIAAGLYYPQQPNLPGDGLSPTLGAALSDITIALFFAGVQFTDAAQRGWTISKLRDITRMSGWQSAAAIAAGCETAWVKAYEAGKGPPYQRTMDNQSRDSRVSGKHVPEPTTREGVITPAVENDRRFVTVDQGARVHWASGLLSLDKDFSGMRLNSSGDNTQEIR